MLSKKKDPQNLSVTPLFKKKEVKQQYSKGHLMQKHVKFILYQMLCNLLLQKRNREKDASKIQKKVCV